MTRTAYNVGRVVTYAGLGALIGLGGNVVSLAGYGRALSVTSGIAMVVLALAQLVWHWNLPIPGVMLRLTNPARAQLGRLLQHHSTGALFGIGMLNGLLPCGMVTAALVGAAGTGSIGSSALFMAAFGLGTAPVMTAVAVATPLMTGRWKASFRVAAPVVALIMGTLIVVRGMGLGIPLLSPKPVTSTAASCCSSH